MTETDEPATTPTLTTSPPPPPPLSRDVPEHRPASRLLQTLVWVGITAGAVFIVAVVFFSGFLIGKHSGPGYGHLRGPGGLHMLHRAGPPPMGPMGEWPGPGRMGPGQMGPRGPMGPGQMGPGGTTNTPPPTATTAPPRP